MARIEEPAANIATGTFYDHYNISCNFLPCPPPYLNSQSPPSRYHFVCGGSPATCSFGEGSAGRSQTMANNQVAGRDSDIQNGGEFDDAASEELASVVDR